MDFKEAERTSAKIAEIRSTLRVKPEFKFSKCSDDHRSKFFTALADHKFSVRSIVIDKRFIYSAHLKGLPSAFYNYVVQSLLKHKSGRLKDAHIKIDGSGNRVFRRKLYSYLRKQLPAGCAKSIKFLRRSYRALLSRAWQSVTGLAMAKLDSKANRGRMELSVRSLASLRPSLIVRQASTPYGVGSALKDLVIRWFSFWSGLSRSSLSAN